jgi:hypothetical protein
LNERWGGGTNKADFPRRLGWQANVLSKMKLSSTEQLVEWLEKENEKV